MIQLTMTDEQAKIVAKACEFYARMKMGQYQEVVYNCMEVKTENYSQRRACAEKALILARTYTHPDLMPNLGHSWGIGKFEDADKAFDVYQVIRVLFGDHREPFSYYDLPKCERVMDK